MDLASEKRSVQCIEPSFINKLFPYYDALFADVVVVAGFGLGGFDHLDVELLDEG